jgi:predicted extracellular nuclease
MRTNRFILIIALATIVFTSCVKDELYVDDTIIAESYIVMNEIYSRGTVDNPDWVEIYNTSDAAIDVSGYKIYDGGGQSGAKPKLAFPAGTIIPAKGFFVIAVDTPDPAGFGLSSGGDILWLENSNGELIDNVEIPAMPVETTSYGRMPDGSETWQILQTITKGTANDDSTPPPAPIIRINEVYSRGIAGNMDWVEVYNTSSSEVNISGFKIYDNGGQSGAKPKKEFPTGTIVPANGFVVIVVDSDDASGFGISSGGETIWLENASGTVIDEVAVPTLDVTQSYGRFADGTNNLQVLNFITRGSANNNGSTPVIKMNEIYSRGTTAYPDWIEVYNTSADPVDITGYKIYDSGAQTGSKPKKAFPAGSIVPGNGFLLIVVDDTDASGFGLGSGGEDVWLENASGAIIDFVSFPALDATQSFGRMADGAHNWKILGSITPNSINIETAPAPILMNEIYSRGTAEAPDWIEIYNNSSAPIDISGYKIYDSGGQTGAKPKMVFAAETVIPANGFFVIVVDDAATANPEGSSFGLGSGGEQVWLENASGNIINTISFPALDVTQSFGRIPDGTYNWRVLNTITKGTANAQ